MSKKTYRVVCTKEKFKDEIIVDIVPADGVIHDMIFASRRANNPELQDYAGSVYLTDFGDDRKPVVSFGKMENLSKKCELYKYYERLAQNLTPQIIATYEKMKSCGKESTIDVRVRDYFAAIHDKDDVKTLKDEELKEYAERRLRIENFKKQTLAQKARENAIYKPEVLLAWKQALNRGD